MSSAECLAKIKEYEQVKSSIGGLNSGIDSCSTGISGSDGTGGSNAYVSKIIVGGKPIDEGKLASIAADVAGILGMLSPVSAECDEKIVIWTQRYHEALEREREEEEKMKKY